MSAIAAENWPEALACWRQAIRFEMGILRLLDEVGIDEKLLEEVKSQGIYVVAGSGLLGAEFLSRVCSESCHTMSIFFTTKMCWSFASNFLKSRMVSKAYPDGLVVISKKTFKRWQANSIIVPKRVSCCYNERRM